MWEVHLRRWDLTLAGFTVLQVLGAGALPQARLAAAFEVQEQTMSRTLVRLERQGYVRREPDPGDARRRLVVRTPRGAQVAAASADVGLVESLVGDVEDPALFRRQVRQLLDALHHRRWRGPA